MGSDRIGTDMNTLNGIPAINMFSRKREPFFFWRDIVQTFVVEAGMACDAMVVYLKTTMGSARSALFCMPRARRKGACYATIVVHPI